MVRSFCVRKNGHDEKEPKEEEEEEEKGEQEVDRRKTFLLNTFHAHTNDD